VHRRHEKRSWRLQVSGKESVGYNRTHLRLRNGSGVKTKTNGGRSTSGARRKECGERETAERRISGSAPAQLTNYYVRTQYKRERREPRTLDRRQVWLSRQQKKEKGRVEVAGRK
jgi:hypothetical protein